MADVHDGMREGAALGLTVAASTWLWIALVDTIAGQPFYTFDFFGGIAVFTPIHCLLNVVYGVAIVSAVHGAARTPSLIYAVGFGLLFLQIVFAFATVALRASASATSPGSESSARVSSVRRWRSCSSPGGTVWPICSARPTRSTDRARHAGRATRRPRTPPSLDGHQ
jgi:hypothetical protein